MATTGPPIGISRGRTTSSPERRRSPFRERLFPKAMIRSSSRGGSLGPLSPSHRCTTLHTTPAASLDDLEETVSVDSEGGEVFLRNSSTGTFDNSTKTKRASNQIPKRMGSRLGTFLHRSRSTQSLTSFPSEDEASLSAEQALSPAASLDPERTSERAMSPVNASDLREASSFEQKQRKRSLLKSGGFFRRAFSFHGASTDETSSTDGTGLAEEELLAPIDETMVLFDEENTVFEISLARQNYTQEEIWKEAVDNEIAQAQGESLEAAMLPPQIHRTSDVHGLSTVPPQESEAADSEPVVSRSEPERTFSGLDVVAENKKAESDPSPPSASSNDSEPSLASTWSHSEQSSVPLTWKVAVSVDPSPPRAEPNESESRGSRSANEPRKRGNADQTPQHSPSTPRPIVWVTLTPSGDIPGDSLHNTVPAEDARSQASASLQYSDDASRTGSKISMPSTRSGLKQSDTDYKKAGSSSVKSSGDPATPESADSEERSQISEDRSQKSSSSKSQRSRKSTREAKSQSSRKSSRSSAKPLGSMSGKQSNEDDTTERRSVSGVPHTSNKSVRNSVMYSKAGLPPLPPQGRTTPDNRSTCRSATSTSSRGKRSLRTTSRQSVSSIATPEQKSGGDSAASSIKEYPSRAEVGDAPEPNGSAREKPTQGPVDLDISFSESEDDLSTAMSPFYSSCSVLSKTSRQGPIDLDTSFSGPHDDLSSALPASLPSCSAASKTGCHASEQGVSPTRSKASRTSSEDGSKFQKSHGEGTIARQDSRTPKTARISNQQEDQESVKGGIATSSKQTSNTSSQSTSDSPKSVFDSGNKLGSSSANENQSKTTVPSNHNRSFSRSHSSQRSKSQSEKHGSICSNAGDSRPMGAIEPIVTVLSELSWDSMPEENWDSVHGIPETQSPELVRAGTHTKTVSRTDPEELDDSTSVPVGPIDSHFDDVVRTAVSKDSTRSKNTSRSNGTPSNASEPRSPGTTKSKNIPGGKDSVASVTRSVASTKSINTSKSDEKASSASSARSVESKDTAKTKNTTKSDEKASVTSKNPSASSKDTSENASIVLDKSLVVTGAEAPGAEELIRTIKKELEKLHIDTSEVVIRIAPRVSKQRPMIDRALLSSVRGRVRSHEKARAAAAAPSEEVRSPAISPSTASSTGKTNTNSGLPAEQEFSSLVAGCKYPRDDNSVLEGIGQVDGADLVGSAHHLAAEIVTAIDDIAGATVERAEGRRPSQDLDAAIHSGTVCGTKFGWDMAEHFFKYLTSCSSEDVSMSEHVPASRVICEDPVYLPASSSTVEVEEIRGSLVRSRLSPLSVVKEEEEYESSWEEKGESVTGKSRENTTSPCESEPALIDRIRQSPSYDSGGSIEDDRARFQKIRWRGSYTIEPPALRNKTSTHMN